MSISISLSVHQKTKDDAIEKEKASQTENAEKEGRTTELFAIE